MEKIYLFSYDISNNKLRRKVANKLLYYGLDRVQLSVFMGTLRQPLFQKATLWLQQNIKGKDKLLILPLPPQTPQNALMYGTPFINWLSITHQQNTLYIK